MTFKLLLFLSILLGEPTPLVIRFSICSVKSVFSFKKLDWFVCVSSNSYCCYKNFPSLSLMSYSRPLMR